MTRKFIKMKNIIIAFVVCLIALTGQAQEMSWIPSKYIKKQQEIDLTNCDENVVCYTLQYIPNQTGMLTSYTTGFIMDCDQGINAIKLNSSNTLNDHSQEIIGCDRFGKIMLHCSGNDGNLNVEKDVPVYLHQICVQTQHKTNDLMILKSDLAGLTSSLNLEDGTPATEHITYRPYKVLNNAVYCQQPSSNLTLEAELKEDAKVLLNWEPAKEDEGGVYEVYQSFENGSFDAIKLVPARVLTQQISDKYSLDVDLQNQGEYTFKVVYKHKDGTSFTSNQAAVYFRNQDFNFTLTVSPNPTSQFINVEVNSENEIINVHITDTSGKLVKRTPLASNSINKINLESLPPGMYTVIAISGEDILSERILLVR